MRRPAVASRVEESRVILWDLDGTLVGIHFRALKALMPLLAMKALRDIIPPRRLLAALKDVVPRVRNNAGSTTNYELLVRLLAEHTDAAPTVVDTRLHHLSDVEFRKLRRCFFPIPPAKAMVNTLFQQGHRQVIATNPLWPLSSVVSRLRWAELDPDRFVFIASSETMHHSKADSVGYFSELLGQVSASANDCVMIGNDPCYDVGATRLGIPVFLLGGTAPSRARPDSLPAGPLLTTGTWDDLGRWVELAAARCSSS